MAVHTDRVEWVRRQLDPPARSDILVAGFCLKTCSCRQTIEPSRGECQALRARPERGVCTPPNQCSSHAPTFLTVGSKKHRRRQHRDPSMYAAYGPRGRYRNHAFPENLTWSSLDRSISAIARCTITCLVMSERRGVEPSFG